MGERFKNGLLIFIYSFGAGLMLAVFTLLKGGVNILFSLLAFLIGLYFFRKFPKMSSRIIFVLLAIFFFFLIVIIIALVQYMRSNPGAS